MAYAKQLETGIILELREFGESGKLLKILTSEGIKNLVATGVRELRSKMRGEIDVLTEVEFEYVEGKEVMRLVGIFPKKRFFDFSGDEILKKRRIISNIVNFVLRSVVGETENQKLYSRFLEALVLLNKFKGNFEIFEIIFLVQVLSSLGYWEEGKFDEFTEENFKILEEEMLRKQVVEDVNKSIASTHL